MKGTLYIVSTPIGNLEDITFRAIKTLNIVDIIACEDTRTTRKLLNHYNISKPLTSYHEHNEKIKAGKLVNSLKDGLNIALVTDSGTPLVSDPGYNLVKSSIENGINVIPVPGPTALISALTASGIASTRFLFMGFLPRTIKKFYELLDNIGNYPYTLVFYESPRRIIKSLEYIRDKLGDREIALSRELTKIHEETIRGRISEILKELKDRKSIKGELTLVIEGSGKSDINEDYIKTTLHKLKLGGKSLKESVQILKTISNNRKSKIYKTALKIWEQT